MFEPSKLFEVIGEPLPTGRLKKEADPFSLESLVAWLETNPAGAEYDYGCNGHCLIAQYLTHRGYTLVEVGGWTFDTNVHRDAPIPLHWNPIAQGVLYSDQRTFGGALSRARSFLQAEGGSSK